jgi:uncharacterized protein YigE (DUF2233 family)
MRPSNPPRSVALVQNCERVAIASQFFGEIPKADMSKARTIAFLVAAAISLVDHNDSARAQPQPCRAREYAHNAYTICEVDLGKHTVKLYWKRSDGTPYAYLSSLPRVLEHETGRLLFATNAGMFDPALKPVGLYVEQGGSLCT